MRESSCLEATKLLTNFVNQFVIALKDTAIVFGDRFSRALQTGKIIINSKLPKVLRSYTIHAVFYLVIITLLTI